MLFFLIGEVYFRFPSTLRMLSYEFDSDLAMRLRPNQRGVSIIGKGTFTPAITLNLEGYRGESINGKKTILCLGSSEVLGTGVKDNETWVSILERTLVSRGIDIQTINAGNPGYGPYHFKITLERFLLKHPAPEAVIIRINTGDMDFVQPSQNEIETVKKNNYRNTKLKKITIFLPYLFNKMERQKKSILQVFDFKKKSSVNELNKYESSQAADTMINRFRADFKSIVSICQKQNILLIFSVIDPISTPSSVRLASQLDSLTISTGYKKAFVYPILCKEYNLQNYSLLERKKAVMETLRLPGDPHSNALQHLIIGERLSDYYVSLLHK